MLQSVTEGKNTLSNEALEKIRVMNRERTDIMGALVSAQLFIQWPRVRLKECPQSIYLTKLVDGHADVSESFPIAFP